MISRSEKRRILLCIDELEHSINDNTTGYFHQDESSPSSYLLYLYNTYSEKAFAVIENNKQESLTTSNPIVARLIQKDYTEVVNNLELDQFTICAADSYITSKKKLLDYITRIKSNKFLSE